MDRTREEKLLNPEPGSKAAAARDYGIDLSLLAVNLRMTPAERIRSNDAAINDLAKLQLAVKRAKASRTND